MSQVEALQDAFLRTLSWLMTRADGGGKLILLMYHRVLSAKDPLLPSVPDAAQFDWQMALLHRAFRVLPLTEAVRLMRTDGLPSRAVCVTFDDGYADNYQIAFPILKRWGISATFFVATGFLDGGRMWNDSVIETVRRWQGGMMDLTDLGLTSYPVATPAERRATVEAILSQWKYLSFGDRDDQVMRLAELCGAELPRDLMMTSAQVAELHREGMEIGAHTITHPILTRIDNGRAAREIVQSKTDLEAVVGAPVRTFAYPNGNPRKDYERCHVDMVRDAGFEAAVSTAWGCAKPDRDRLQLPRIWPWDRTPFRYGLRMLSSYRAPAAGAVVATPFDG